MSISAIPLDKFKETFESYIELTSVALGGRIVSCSDEFFSPAVDLLKVGPAVNRKGQFGPNGALFDGWESRRHSAINDWVIIRLGAPAGQIIGFDIDTSNFNGNEAPAASVYAHYAIEDKEPQENDEWLQILPETPLGPSSRHLFLLPQLTNSATHLKLCMHPDGGIARFRAYGTVMALAEARVEDEAVTDMAYVMNGGRVVYTSDQHFGVGGNLILPGRGFDMSDGWETARSRKPGHSDHAIIRLGSPGYLQYCNIDTANFLGNYPQLCELQACSDSGIIPSNNAKWTTILPKTKMGPHREHYLQLELTEFAITHVKLTIHPDGGVKRLRLYGSSKQRLSPLPLPSSATVSIPAELANRPVASLATASSQTIRVPALPLTFEAFSPYGKVIQSFPDVNSHSVPKGLKTNSVNMGTAIKYNHLAPSEFTTPASRPELKAQLNFSVYRCGPQQFDGFEIKVLERHEWTTQAFIPMGKAADNGKYLVVVALPGEDGQADLKTLRAFVASSGQGISYHRNIWHHPMIALDETSDFACLTYETGEGAIDCEIKEYQETIAVVEQIGQ